MVYGLRAQSPKYDWDQGSEERAQGSEEWDQGSDLLHGLKISYHIEFPGRGTLPILTSGWRQFLSYEVLVV